MSKTKAWLNAARLRTLPLSISGIIVGTGLAGFYGYTDPIIFFLALLTTIGFQVTSNFANDYGDGVKGTDNEDRIGPKRALQSGILSKEELKLGIVLSIVINILLVLLLVYMAFGIEYYGYILLFLVLGAASIWAAIKYTVGTSAYGYKGLGDLFVFLFFGLLGVLGCMFLYTKFINMDAFLPAITIGLLSVGVLNLNNLRDSQSDKKAGKNTLVVKMGYQNGKRYHYFLLLTAFLAMLVFIGLNFMDWISVIPLLGFVPIGAHVKKVYETKDQVLLDPELKKLALSTFLLAILFYFSFNIFS
ncbi:1,4-dihydroxy-2-naphthoate octaprenyltransferase [Sediminicola sp. 1XM1-17]|uniref:1,4-dihydroxy-2-naphthoate octaprenyltransferase n=1 Tax=Sediminicola sp. 1XM1-17 TaxID=3127702 RepID=UPI0030787A64